MPPSHETRYRTAIEALANGDLHRFLGYLAEDVQWWELGARQPIVGRLALEQHLSTNVVDPVARELHDVLTNEEHLVALIHASAVIGADTVGMSYAEVLHFDDRGLVTKRQVFPSDIWAALELVDSKSSKAQNGAPGD